MTKPANNVHQFSTVDTREHSFTIGFDFSLYHTDSKKKGEKGIIVVAKTADSPEGTHYAAANTKAEFLQKYPTLESLLKYLAINPEWNEPNTQKHFFYINTLNNFQGLYKLGNESPVFLIDTKDLHYTEDNPQDLIPPLDDSKPNRHKHHVYDSSTLDRTKLSDYEQFATNLTIHKTFNEEGQHDGMLYIAYFPEGDTYTIKHFSLQDFNDKIKSLENLIEDIFCETPFFDMEGNPGLIFVKEIENNQKLFRINKYAPYFIYQENDE